MRRHRAERANSPHARAGRAESLQHVDLVSSRVTFGAAAELATTLQSTINLTEVGRSELATTSQSTVNLTEVGRSDHVQGCCGKDETRT